MLSSKVCTGNSFTNLHPLAGQLLILGLGEIALSFDWPTLPPSEGDCPHSIKVKFKKFTMSLASTEDIKSAVRSSAISKKPLITATKKGVC
jgi:hypothetical protein